MKIIRALLILFVLVVVSSCNKEDLAVNQSVNNQNDHDFCTVDGCDHTDDIVFNEGGIRWLWGGHDDDWHFNISNLDIDTERLKSGLGREFFKALIEPKYHSMQQFTNFFADDDEFIIVHAEEGIKAYSLDLLIQHEVINDVIDGQPVMVGYCVIADFAGVFNRNYCGKTLTFALSGYVYSEPGVWFGRDGFVLWDRDTESLWWPLKGKAVSGTMIGIDFNTDLSFEWDRVNWDYIKSNYSEMEILAYGQDMQPPTNWQRLSADELDCD